MFTLTLAISTLDNIPITGAQHDVDRREDSSDILASALEFMFGSYSDECLNIMTDWLRAMYDDNCPCGNSGCENVVLSYPLEGIAKFTIALLPASV